MNVFVDRRVVVQVKTLRILLRPSTLLGNGVRRLGPTWVSVSTSHEMPRYLQYLPYLLVGTIPYLYPTSNSPKWRIAPVQITSMSAHRLPTYYRLFFLYIEPISALVGAFYAFFKPDNYLQLTHTSAPSGGIPLSCSIVLTQLSNLYLLFALNEAFVLRSTRDLRVWRTLLTGLLMADFGHLYSVSALGPDVYWKVNNWNAMDWGNVAFVYVGATMRIAFLLGLGLPTAAASGRKKGNRGLDSEHWD